MRYLRQLVFVSTALLAAGSHVFGAAVMFSATGDTPASIAATVDAFRTAIGGVNNGGSSTSFATGRREVNWDGVPAAFRNPHPGNFFNSNSTRGIEFTTPGTGFAVSGDIGSPQELFEDITPYTALDEFQAFSSPRIFGILGSDIMDARFFLPSTATAATTSAFGLIFIDSDFEPSSLTFYDQSDNLLGTISAGPGTNRQLTFLGLLFNAGERIGRVRIQAGSGPFTAADCGDCVVMDDFLYAEPQGAVPEPAAVFLALAGFGLLAIGRKRFTVS